MSEFTLWVTLNDFTYEFSFTPVAGGASSKYFVKASYESLVFAHFETRETVPGEWKIIAPAPEGIEEFEAALSQLLKEKRKSQKAVTDMSEKGP